jgi:hypothetical protein
MSDTTYTPDEIRVAVLEYSQGCYEGKVEFLSEAFGIDANPEQTIEVTVRVTLPTYDTDGDEIDAIDLNSAVERTLDSYLSDEIGAESGSIDART